MCKNRTIIFKKRTLREILEGSRNIDQEDAECRRREDGSAGGCQGEKRKVGKKEE
jgi:hypothetical protein